jgi:hypothetical protein
MTIARVAEQPHLTLPHLTLPHLTLPHLTLAEMRQRWHMERDWEASRAFSKEECRNQSFDFDFMFIPHCILQIMIVILASGGPCVPSGCGAAAVPMVTYRC